MALGGANIAAGLTGGFAVGSSTSRTAALDQAGSRTQLPSIVTAVGTLLLVVFGTALLEHIPSPAIGAIVGVAVVPLLGVAEFRQLWRLDRAEFAVGGVCFLGALLLGPIAGIALAFVLSLIVLAGRAANPPVSVLSRTGIEDGSLTPVAADAPLTAPGMIVLRFAAPVFFANSTGLGDSVRRAVRAAGTDQVAQLILDLEAVTDVDVTGAENLESLRDWLRGQQITLGYSRARPEILARLDHFGLLDAATVYRTNREALTALVDTTSADAPHQPRPADPRAGATRSRRRPHPAVLGPGGVTQAGGTRTGPHGRPTRSARMAASRGHALGCAPRSPREPRSKRRAGLAAVQRR